MYFLMIMQCFRNPQKIKGGQSCWTAMYSVLMKLQLRIL